MNSKVLKLEAIIENLKLRVGNDEYLEYGYYAIRRESRFGLPEGFVFDASKSNLNREDAREFPEFGTEKYDDLEELDGTCCYEIFDGDRASLSLRDVKSWIASNDESAWYLIGGNELTNDDAEDNWEIVLKDATVICEL